MHDNSKNVLVLPGTKWSEGLCKKIKEEEHKIFLVSPEENPYCRDYADVFFKSDIFDIDSIIAFCKEKKIDAIVSDECDIAIPVVAELGEKLGLPVIDRNTAALYTDKFLMREFAKKNSIPYPDYCLCHSIDDAMAFLNKIGTDIIIKPIDSNASHGVFTIHDEADLMANFDEALSFSRVEKAVLAERYINGTEFTIDGIKTPLGHFTLAISKKKHFGYNSNIANELFFTHFDDEFDYEQLKKTNDQFVNMSSLKFGFTHAEYKFENGKFYLIEIAARGGGNQISSIITQYMSGKDTYSYLLNCSLGRVDNIDFNIEEKFIHRAAVLRFFDVPGNGGNVIDIVGENFLRNDHCILDYKLNFGIGDYIHNAENDSVRIGYYIAGAKDEQTLREVMKNVEDNFHIVIG